MEGNYIEKGTINIQRTVAQAASFLAWILWLLGSNLGRDSDENSLVFFSVSGHVPH
jgi:hypothetical protein